MDWMEDMFEDLQRGQVAAENLAVAEKKNEELNIEMDEMCGQLKELEDKFELAVRSREDVVQNVERLMCQVEELHGAR